MLVPYRTVRYVDVFFFLNLSILFICLFVCLLFHFSFITFVYLVLLFLFINSYQVFPIYNIYYIADFIPIEKNNIFQAMTCVRSFLKDRIAQYKQPQELFIVENIPRNHLGKVSYDYCAYHNYTTDFVLCGECFVFLRGIQITVIVILLSKTRMCRKQN